MKEILEAFTSFFEKLTDGWEIPGVIVAILAAGFRVGQLVGRHQSDNWKKLVDAEKQAEESEKKAAAAEKRADTARAQLKKILGENRKYHAIRDALLGRDTDLWAMHKAAPYSQYDDHMMSKDLQVLTVMNLKGGVGKTTIATNLAAYFETVHNKRVLVVDLDFQASATNVMLNLSDLDSLDIEGVGRLFRPEIAGEPHPHEVMLRLRGGRLPNTALIPCGYLFSGIENRQMVAWLLEELAEDPRYRLAKFLYSERARSLFKYDMVIIDAPPRLSLGAINALTASSTLIVPTMPDRISSETVLNFIQVTNSLAPMLNRSLDRMIVTFNRTSGVELNDKEQAVAEQVRGYAEQWHGIARMAQTNIPRRAAFTNATYNRTLAFFENDNGSARIRDILTAFGDEVAYELGMPLPRAEGLVQGA